MSIIQTMRLLILLFITLLSFYSVQAEDPGKQCILDSARCILSDFTPKVGERLCETAAGSSIETNPSLIECGALEVCAGSSHLDNIKCNLVPGASNDADDSNDGEVEAACKNWKKNKFCVTDTGAWIGIGIGALVFVGGVAFLIYYFTSQAKPAVAFTDVNADRFRRSKKRKVFKAYRDHV